MAKKIYTLTDVLSFGKYKGKTVVDVIERNHKYIAWCLANLTHFGLDAAAEEC